MENNTPTHCDYYGHEFVEEDSDYNLRREFPTHLTCKGCDLTRSIENISLSENASISYEEMVAMKNEDPTHWDYKLNYTDIQ